MPKMKTHRGAAKRFRVSGSGKLRRRRAYRSHLNGKKSPKRLRRLGRPALVSDADERNVRRLIGG